MDEFAGHAILKPAETRPLGGTGASQATSLFSDLWNGRPISLPTHSWALHRIEKTGLGPLIVINEMMFNGHGVPFPLKQLVITSSGSMMALILNQIFDISLLTSVLPPQTIEDLQEALKYFEQIDCEYMYYENV